MVRPSPKKTPEQLRLWIESIVRREQEAGTYGVVSVHMEAGRVVRVRTERTEMPQDDES